MVSRSFLAAPLTVGLPWRRPSGRSSDVGGTRRLQRCPRGARRPTPPASGRASRSRRSPRASARARVGQLRIVRSAPPEKSASPSAENATVQTQPEWPDRRTGSRSGSRHVPEADGAVEARGGEPRALGAELQARDGRGVAGELDLAAVEAAREEEDRPFHRCRRRRRRRGSPRRRGACGPGGAGVGRRPASPTSQTARPPASDAPASVPSFDEGERDDPRLTRLLEGADGRGRPPRTGRSPRRSAPTMRGGPRSPGGRAR